MIIIDNYLLYIGVALATILLLGPAVMLTVNNSIQRGFLKSLAGIFGIATAILIVAAISATSIGVLLASSAVAFTVVKIAGAIYLIYLGIKMWRARSDTMVHSIYTLLSSLARTKYSFLGGG